MNDNIYGIDLGTCNFKVFSKATGKILKEMEWNLKRI